MSRSLYYLHLDRDDGSRMVYAVDLHNGKRFMSQDGKGSADLYLDGRRTAVSTLPAAFPVEDGVIEVQPTAFGLKRAHYVTTAGVERRLIPDEGSAEGRRARLDRDRPVLSRAIGVLSATMLLVGVVLLLSQLVGPITSIPAIAASIGSFESPLVLPVWLNIALGLGAVAASTERALRLRYTWLDSAGN